MRSHLKIVYLKIFSSALSCPSCEARAVDSLATVLNPPLGQFEVFVSCVAGSQSSFPWGDTHWGPGLDPSMQTWCRLLSWALSTALLTNTCTTRTHLRGSLVHDHPRYMFEASMEGDAKEFAQPHWTLPTTKCSWPCTLYLSHPPVMTSVKNLEPPLLLPR